LKLEDLRILYEVSDVTVTVYVMKIGCTRR
jgi:mRNA-degrading endonuclease RelE of RelBE toxin-antitoxin system